VGENPERRLQGELAMQWRKAAFAVIVVLLSMATVAQNASTGPQKWFLAGTVSNEKFVPFDDLATDTPRWDKTPKTLAKQHVQAGSDEPVDLGPYAGKAIFLFADKNGATASSLYGVIVIGSIEKLAAEQLWKDAKGGGIR
jgi:hypothetical protein